MNNARCTIKKQHGMAVVELALITTVMLFLLMVCSEFGRLFYKYNELTKAIQPAARYLSENALSSAGSAQVSAADMTTARNLVVYGHPLNTGQPRFENLSVNDVVVEADASFVTTSVSWNYPSLFGGSIPTFGFSNEDIDSGALVLRASLTMRVLN